MKNCKGCNIRNSGGFSTGWAKYLIGSPVSDRGFILCGQCQADPEVQPDDFVSNSLLFKVSS